MVRCIVLLRAVNVGGRALTAPTWAKTLSDAGLSALTVGASGNAIVEARGSPRSSALESRVEKALAQAAGLVADAFVRTVEEWDLLVERNPFGAEARTDPAHLVLTVLKDAPTPAAWAALRASIRGRERVAPGERCAYLVYPDGIGTSKLTATTLERSLGVRGTSRNWNTALRLQALGRSWVPPDGT